MATQAEILKMDADHRLETYNRFWYPGRGIVMGLSEDKKFLIQVYWITGRSPNSQNRIFVDMGGGTLATVPADPSKVEDPSLIIYNAMLEHVEMEEKSPHDDIVYARYAVSNGHQTEDLLSEESDIIDFLDEWQYEPNQPNFTPRISGLLVVARGPGDVSSMDYTAMICVCKKSPHSIGRQDAVHFYGDFEAGYGYCVTTYARPEGEMGLKNQEKAELVSFSGEPYLMKLPGSPEDMLNAYWDALHPDNRISVAVKAIDVNTGKSFILVKNKHELPI